MMPRDEAAYWDALRRWACGDQKAAEFLDIICRTARLADNIADGDSKNVHEDMGRLLHILMVDLPQNEFFYVHLDQLRAPLTESILNWVASEQWRDGDRKQQTFAYVLRESTDRLAVAVSSILGGYDAARLTMNDVYQITEAGETESLDDWIAEKKA